MRGRLHDGRLLHQQQPDNADAFAKAMNAIPPKEKPTVRPLYIDMKRCEDGEWKWRVRCGKTDEVLSSGATPQLAKAYTEVTLVMTDLAHGTGKFAKPQRTQERRG
jgi:hypothetical protein